RVRRAVAIQYKIGRARADIDHEHAVLALLGRRHHVAGREAREDEFADVEIEAANHVDVIGEALFLAVHGPVTDIETLPAQILRTRGHEAAIDAKRAAQVVHDHAAGGQLLRAREIAHRPYIVAIDHVVGGLHAHGGLVVEALEVRAGLREVHVIHALAGFALGL